MSNTTNKAADVARAYQLTRGDHHARKELFGIIRRWMHGLPPDQADKALCELLHEIEVCEQVVLEEAYGADFSNWHNEPDDPDKNTVPF
jgi:hypothetical protein